MGVVRRGSTTSPGVTPPDKTRQLCNLWKADRTIAATTLVGAQRRVRRPAGGRPGHDGAVHRQRGVEAGRGRQGAVGPSGRRLSGRLRPGQSDDVLDGVWTRRTRTPARFTTPVARNSWGRSCRWAGQFHAPDDWDRARPAGRAARAVRRGRVGADRGARRRRRVPRTAGRSTARRPTSVPTGAACDHQPHDEHGRRAGIRRTSTRSTAATGGPASSRSTRRSSR